MLKIPESGLIHFLLYWLRAHEVQKFLHKSTS